MEAKTNIRKEKILSIYIFDLNIFQTNILCFIVQSHSEWMAKENFIVQGDFCLLYIWK